MRMEDRRSKIAFIIRLPPSSIFHPQSSILCALCVLCG
jgi:hypothetical protein